MTDEQVVNFIEWMLESMPIEYSGDTRTRFTPQIVMEGQEFVWIETHKFLRGEPKFYTTQEILDIYKETIT